MFNFGFAGRSELAILGLLGLGLYAQSNELNLANNTSILLILFLLFLEQEQIEEIQHEVEDDDDDHHHCRCEQLDGCGCRGFDDIGFRRRRFNDFVDGCSSCRRNWCC